MLQGLPSLPAGSFGSAVASVKDKDFSGRWIMVTANRGDLQRKIDWISSAWNSKTEVRWGTPTRGSNHNPATVRVGLSARPVQLSLEAQERLLRFFGTAEGGDAVLQSVVLQFE